MLCVHQEESCSISVKRLRSTWTCFRCWCWTRRIAFWIWASKRMSTPLSTTFRERDKPCCSVRHRRSVCRIWQDCRCATPSTSRFTRLLPWLHPRSCSRITFLHHCQQNWTPYGLSSKTQRRPRLSSSCLPASKFASYTKPSDTCSLVSHFCISTEGRSKLHVSKLHKSSQTPNTAVCSLLT